MGARSRASRPGRLPLPGRWATNEGARPPRTHPSYGELVIEAARRRKSQPAPPHVVFEALTQPDRDPQRPWMRLEPDEVRPAVLHAEPPHDLLWSSLWPAHPRALVHIQLDQRTDDSGADLTWSLLLPQDTGDVVGADEIRALRRRLNRLINGHLREAFDL